MSRRHNGRSRQGRQRGDDHARAPGAGEPRPAERSTAQAPESPTAPAEAGPAEAPPVESGSVAVAVEEAPPVPVEAAERSAAERTSPERAAFTAPQLRRFIKSRPYVPLHELRRRFGIDGTDDDVAGFDALDGRIYVGLPEPECRLLGELVRAGEVGYELSLDPRTPIVVGVYPMRPIPRG